ncbi:MAG: RNA methyltransferase [Polyangiaceae bacterium]
MRRVAAALLHYPVLDRGRQVVTTAITNLDLHDIARSSHTYGLSDYFVVHPIAAQRELAERVQAHWTAGSGARRIPDRSPALAGLRVVATLDDALGALGDPEIWVTSAEAGKNPLAFADARAMLQGDGPPVLLVFGTGWGLAPSVLERARHQLAPVRSPRADGYNHLSVRAAAAIIFDRLLGVP